MTRYGSTYEWQSKEMLKKLEREEETKHKSIMDYFGTIELKDHGKREADLQYLVVNPLKMAACLEYLCEKGIEITITFLPQLHDNLTPESLANLLDVEFTKLRKRYKFEVMLVPEYSDLGNFHYHGALVTDQPRVLNSIKRLFPRRIGRTQIKYIKYTQSWYQYVLKKDHGEKHEPHEKGIKHTYVVDMDKLMDPLVVVKGVDLESDKYSCYRTVPLVHYDPDANVQ